MTERRDFEVIIIGGGIAGAALGYSLARRGVTDVLLLEREAQPGYHSSGRSAAAVVSFNRSPLHRRLIQLGAAVLRRPPADLADAPLLEEHGVIVPAGPAALPELARFAGVMAGEGIGVEVLAQDAACARHPALTPARFAGGLWFPTDGAIDLGGLLQGYLRRLARGGGLVRLATEVRAVVRAGGRATGVETGAGRFGARWIVDAAGAWAGEVAALAGALPIPITPRRRTIVTFAAPAGLSVRGLPMIDCEEHRFYVKAESGGFLASAMDETPATPGDAAPTEEDVATAVDRVATYTPLLAPAALRRRWAGLRSFAPDLAPVVGQDPRVEGFFWLAGQGGVGIETSPVLGQLAADLLLDGRSDACDAAPLAPGRFAAP
jgi:D-arginine dehydrogenase